MKKFTLIYTEDDEGMVTCYGNNEGFTGTEIVGMLEMKKLDTLEQMAHSERFKRYAVDSDGIRKKIEKEGESAE